MKRLIYISIILFNFLLISCDKDNDVTTDMSTSLIGYWELKEINFTSNVRAWENETYKNETELFGWAPFMQGFVSGIDLTDEDYVDEKTGNSGKICTVVTHISKTEMDGIFWVWNLNEDKTAFALLQLNSQMPPYNFSWAETTSLKIEKVNGQEVMTCRTTFESVDQDRLDESPSPLRRPKINVDANLTLVKTNNRDRNSHPQLKLNGAAFLLPEQAIVE